MLPGFCSRLIGSAAAVSGWYALAWKETDAQDNFTNVLVTYSTDISDAGDIHNTSADTDDFVIPASWNGRYASLSANIKITGSVTNGRLQSEKNGAAYIGNGIFSNDHTSLNIYGAPVVVATGDVFNFRVSTASATDDLAAGEEETWACVELMPSTFDGVLARKSSTQATGAGVPETVVFQGTDVYDTDDYHDPVTNNTRLSTKSGKNLVQVYGCVSNDTDTGQAILFLQKNGASFLGMFQNDHETSGSDQTSAISPPLVVNGGTDYFTLVLQHDQPVLISNDEHTWFGMRVLPADTEYAFVSRATSNFALGVGTPAAVDWNNEVADAAGYWAVGSPSKFIVPAGKGGPHRIGANIQTVSGTGTTSVTFHKNGAVFVGTPTAMSTTNASDLVNAVSAIVELNDGDEIECIVTQTGGQDVVFGNTSWFWIMRIPALTS